MSDASDPNQREEVPFPTGSAPGRRFLPPSVSLPNGNQAVQQAPQQRVMSVAEAQALAQANGHQAQGVQYAPEQQSPEWEGSLIKGRLAQLAAGHQAGLFETADFMADVVVQYQQRFQQTTGQPITFRQALNQIVNTLELVAE